MANGILKLSCYNNINRLTFYQNYTTHVVTYLDPQNFSVQKRERLYAYLKANEQTEDKSCQNVEREQDTDDDELIAATTSILLPETVEQQEQQQQHDPNIYHQNVEVPIESENLSEEKLMEMLKQHDCKY